MKEWNKREENECKEKILSIGRVVKEKFFFFSYSKNTCHIVN